MTPPPTAGSDAVEHVVAELLPATKSAFVALADPPKGFAADEVGRDGDEVVLVDLRDPSLPGLVDVAVRWSATTPDELDEHEATARLLRHVAPGGWYLHVLDGDDPLSASRTVHELMAASGRPDGQVAEVTVAAGVVGVRRKPDSDPDASFELDDEVGAAGRRSLASLRGGSR